MANPFLVLGGIAVGVITAAFGILQVPGWVASAQDASAINDLRMISEAQAASASITGKYASELSTLQDGGLGLSFSVPDGRVKLFAADGEGWCSVAQSDSGRFFGVSDRRAEAVAADTLDEAVDGACVTVPDGEQGQEPAPEPEPEPEPVRLVGPTAVAQPAFSSAGWIVDMDFSPDSRTAYVAGGRSVRVVDVATETSRGFDTSMTTTDVAVSPDGKYVAVGGDVSVSLKQHKVIVYNTADMTVAKTLTTADIDDVKWTVNGQLAVMQQVGLDGRLEFYDPTTWQVSGKYLANFGSLARLTPLPDGRILLTTMYNKRVVDPATMGMTSLTFNGMNPKIAPVATKDSVWLSYDGHLMQFDNKTFTLMSDFTVAGNVIRTISASPDGKWLYLHGKSGFTVVDVEKKAVSTQLPVADGVSMKAAPDGTFVYAGGEGSAALITKVTAAP